MGAGARRGKRPRSSTVLNEGIDGRSAPWGRVGQNWREGCGEEVRARQDAGWTKRERSACDHGGRNGGNVREQPERRVAVALADLHGGFPLDRDGSLGRRGGGGFLRPTLRTRRLGFGWRGFGAAPAGTATAFVRASRDRAPARAGGGILPAGHDRAAERRCALCQHQQRREHWLPDTPESSEDARHW